MNKSSQLTDKLTLTTWDSDIEMLNYLFNDIEMSSDFLPPRIQRSGGYASYDQDYAHSVTGETFFEQYLKTIHGEDRVTSVPGYEQKEYKRGDCRLKVLDTQKEFEVKLERKGAETGRHALEFGEYDSDALGRIFDERSQGWFRLTMADIVVPVVPMLNGSVLLYPYSIFSIRRHLSSLTKTGITSGADLMNRSGHLDHEKMLDYLAEHITDSAHTLGPVNTLARGGYKRSRSLCIPYEYMIEQQLTKPYRVIFL